jgi:hypothetical protein
VERPEQKASALVETAIAVAMVTTVAGAALSAAIVAGRAAGMHPAQDALQFEVKREMGIALDVLKYQGANIAPTAIATTLPLPAGSPLPVNVSIATTSLPHGPIRVTITASTSRRPTESVSLTAALDERAPSPGAVVHAPALVPAPTGAP